MAVLRDTIPSLLECQCHICLEILIEPVTLPCNHTLCKACFKSTVEKAHLCCPFCRCRVSSWTRYHTWRNSLVNMELWEIIQKHYPEESRLRVSGQQSEEIIDDYLPVHLLSQPGELRREYEKQRSKEEAERWAIQEGENKASEDYIQRLLAEEEEEEKWQAEKRQREMEEELKREEALARRLSLNISNVCEERVSALLSYSKKSNPVTPKSRRKRKSKRKNTGDIQKYLSPSSQLESASQSEVVEEDRKPPGPRKLTAVMGRTLHGKTQKLRKICQHFLLKYALKFKSKMQKLHCSHWSRPQLCASGGEWKLEGKVKTKQISHEEPKAGVSSSGETAVKPYGETESGCTVSDVTQTLKNNTVVTENEESHLLTNKDISRAKNQESLSEAVSNPCYSTKRRKMFLKVSSDQE